MRAQLETKARKSLVAVRIVSRGDGVLIPGKSSPSSIKPSSPESGMPASVRTPEAGMLPDVAQVLRDNTRLRADNHALRMELIALRRQLGGDAAC